jgi:hypothetical protein
LRTCRSAPTSHEHCRHEMQPEPHYRRPLVLPKQIRWSITAGTAIALREVQATS